MDDLRKRAAVPACDTWKLEDLFASDADWQAAFDGAGALINRVAAWAGRLKDADALLGVLRDMETASRAVERLYAYARMHRDEDGALARYQGMTDRAQALAVSLGAAGAFVNPEILALPDETLRAFADDPAFADYDFYLRELMRGRAHTRSAAEERIIAMAGEMAASPDTVYTMLTDADMRFPSVAGDDGETIQLTQANYVPTLMRASRPVRKAVFEAYYATFAQYGATIPALYAASVKTDLFAARTHDYPSARAASLDGDAIPESVYDNLIDRARAHIPALTRYLDLNAADLGLPRLSMYDVYVPSARGFKIELSFPEAYALVVDCLSPMGADYQDVLRRALAERWIDPYENAGKHAGAYSWGAYGVHPYVLLNYKENLDGVETIAHEMGHAMHSYYANGAQPYFKAEYSMFVAEVASTVNEVLIVLALLERYPEAGAQAYLLDNLLSSYRTTLFRQTMFAEFERETHRIAESGEALTLESLNALYAKLNAAYYPNCEQNPEIACEWMRIPHFYRAFYVYVYATGFAAATALAAAIRDEGAPAVARYKEFLRAGGSMHPIDALKLAGLDMTSPEPVERALLLFERLLDRYERAIKAAPDKKA